MNVLISPLSPTPIYEQIQTQIKELILSGQLKSGEQLPSIRLMAKELKVGIITVKRAYDELCAEGMAVSLAGRGIFVNNIDENRVRQIHLAMLSERLAEIQAFCKSTGITREELEEQIQKLYGGQNNE